MAFIIERGPAGHCKCSYTPVSPNLFVVLYINPTPALDFMSFRTPNAVHIENLTKKKDTKTQFNWPSTLLCPLQPRFRSTRPVPAPVPTAGAAAFVAVFFAVAPVTPFRIEPMTPLFVGAALVVATFFTTVPVLASLVSLLALTLRAFLVAGRAAGARDAVDGAAFLAFGAAVVLVELELVVEVVVTFLPAPALVAFAFSTMLENMLEAVTGRATLGFFKGDAGRAMPVLIGEAGRLVRREFEEVGDRT